MYYNARWYDPALGRFAQADSIVPPGAQGLDRYAYVNNNPMIYTDPSGHIGQDTTDSCGPDGIYCDPTPDSYINWDPGTEPIGLSLKDRQAAEDAYIHALKDPQYFYNLYFNSNLNAWESTEVAYLSIYLGYSTLHTSADRYILGLYGQDVTTGSVARGLNSSDQQSAEDYIVGLGIAIAGRGHTGRYWPLNQAEQTAMDKVMADPYLGRELKINMGDTRWPVEEGWVKMERIYGGVKIHWVYSPLLDEFDDFKYK